MGIKSFCVASVATLLVSEVGQAASAELPSYRPSQSVTGVIRVYGNTLADAVPAWQQAFQKHHPDVRFENVLKGSDAALPALVVGAADLAVAGREATLEERWGFYETFQHEVTEMTIGSGTFNVKGKSWGVVAVVHKDNPLTKLTVSQLDGIFGAERSGGWRGMKWYPDDGRGPEQDIRTWGQLGLEGEWRGQPIRTYGYADGGQAKFFQHRVLAGNQKWAPNYHQYIEDSSAKMMTPRAEREGTIRHLLATLANDKYGIAWMGMPQLHNASNVKVLALAPREGGHYVEPTKENFRNRSYPLVRDVYFYFNKRPGQPLDPKLKEFVSFALSRDGQKILADGDVYFPLPAALAAIQSEKLK